MNAHVRAIIITLFVPSFMIGTDFTGALMLVVPIEREFSVDITTTQWVLNVYALTFAMALVAGGRLGDMFGHRRFLLIGMSVFFLGSLACTFAPSIGWLIGARAVQGIGTAMTWPAIVAVATTSVAENQRGLVMGLVLGAVALGNVVGPIIAGVVGGLGEWRLFFLVNVIMAVFSGLMVWRVIARDQAGRPDERIDYAGMAVLSLAILALLYGLDVGSDWGWGSVPIVGLFALCLVLFVAFPFVEYRVKDPMVPPPMMRNRQFMMAAATNGLISPPLFLLFLYLPQYLHKVLGWSEVWAALGTLPIMAVLAVLNVTAGNFYERAGPKRLLLSGYVLACLGSIWMILLEPGWGYAGTIGPMLLLGAAGGLTLGPAATVSVSAADPSRAGLAGGICYMYHLGLGAIGVAGATAIMYATSFLSFERSLAAAGISMPAADQRALNAASAHGAEARDVLAGYGSGAAEKILAAQGDAFIAGMHSAYWLALAFAVLGVVVVLMIDVRKLHGVDTA